MFEQVHVIHVFLKYMLPAFCFVFCCCKVLRDVVACCCCCCCCPYFATVAVDSNRVDSCCHKIAVVYIAVVVVVVNVDVVVVVGSVDVVVVAVDYCCKEHSLHNGVVVGTFVGRIDRTSCLADKQHDNYCGFHLDVA